MWLNPFPQHFQNPPNILPNTFNQNSDKGKHRLKLREAVFLRKRWIIFRKYLYIKNFDTLWTHQTLSEKIIWMEGVGLAYVRNDKLWEGMRTISEFDFHFPYHFPYQNEKKIWVWMRKYEKAKLILILDISSFWKL